MIHTELIEEYLLARHDNLIYIELIISALMYGCIVKFYLDDVPLIFDWCSCTVFAPLNAEKIPEFSASFTAPGVKVTFPAISVVSGITSTFDENPES